MEDQKYKKLTKENIGRIVLTKEEFLKGAKPSALFAEVTTELNTPENYEKIRQLTVKKNRDYAILANQIVGSELRYNIK